MQVTSTTGLQATVVSDPLYRAAELIGDAWSWLVLREAVLHRVSRFTDLAERVGAPRSTLSARLATLVSGGIVARDRQGYTPTEAGEDFLGCLLAAMRWGDRWIHANAPPQPITHLSCGKPLVTTLLCGHCDRVVLASDVQALRATPTPPRPSSTAVKRRPSRDLLERARPCSIASTLTVIGDRWSNLIIREAFFGTRRFDDFQRHLGTAPNILSSRLRQLVELDVLTRVAYQDWPLRHEYRLTERGLDLYHVPLTVFGWGQRWTQPSPHDPQLTHRPCTTPLQTTVACSTCHTAIHREALQLD